MRLIAALEGTSTVPAVLGERIQRSRLVRWWYGHGAVYSFITAAALLVVDIVWVGTYTLLHGWAGVNALFGG